VGHDLLALTGLLTMSAAAAQSQSQDTWHYGVPMLHPRSDFGATVGGDGRIYAVGGRDTYLTNTATAERFDENTGEWTYIASLPYAARGIRMTTDADGRVYAIGGMLLDGTVLDSVMRYDPDTDAWTSVASMNDARTAHAVASDSAGRIYAISGRGTAGRVGSVERYDPSADSWTYLSPLNTPRTYAAAFVDGEDRVYVVGGSIGGGETATMEMYDPAYPGDGWQYVSSMSQPKQVQGTVGADGCFYVAGGWPPYTNIVEKYDPLTDTWSAYSPLNRSTNNMALVSLGRRIYCLGGDFGQTTVEYTDLPWIQPIQIDIKPGCYPNYINVGSHGVVPVAILSSAEFDATEVDPGTVTLAGASVAIKGKGDKLLTHEEDVNDDGLVDLVVQVETENLEPDEVQSGYVCLTGETYGGQAVEGCDEIVVVPPQ